MQPGKYPASRTPIITRSPASAPHVLMKPMPITAAPHARHIPGRKILGPIFLVSTVAPGWKRMYGMKKMSTTRDWVRSQYLFHPSLKKTTYISGSDSQAQLLGHACDHGRSHVASIHEGNAVHQAHRRNEPHIDTMNDLSIRRVGE